MKTYLGIKYEQMNDGRWKVIWPSGVSSISEVETEEDLKKQIDQLKSGG